MILSIHQLELAQQNNINWWKTTAESPDLNPIEILWHELKEYLRRVVKPRTKDQLISGFMNSGKLLLLRSVGNMWAI